MRKHYFYAIIALSMHGASGTAVADSSTDTANFEEAPLLSRAEIFGNPYSSKVAISPDGSRIAFLRPVEGVLNLWIAPTNNLSSAKSITAFEERGISDYPGPQWAANGTHVLFLRDDGGNENYQMFSVPAGGGQLVDLTRNGDVRTLFSRVSVDHPNEVVLGFNDRDPQYHDLYRVDVRSGERRLITQADRMSEIVVDDDLRPVLGKRAEPDGGYAFFRREGDEWIQILLRPMEDAFGATTLGTNRRGEVLLIDSGGSDLANLIAIDLDSGRVRTIIKGVEADINGVMRDEVSGEPLAVSEEFLTREWRAVDARYAADLATISERLGSPFEVVSHSRDNSMWVIFSSKDGAPSEYHLWDSRAQSLRLLFSTHPNLQERELAPMRAVLIHAQDGLPLTSYLTLPAGSDSDSDGVPERPLPLVLNVHGGPWYRDSLGFVPESQWLANRGYAVLSINFRGSTGIGKNFINAANFEWAGKMHRDLIDGVDWAIEEGIADPDKVAIYGLSYGGYSALVGLTFTPERFACAVDMSGPVNLVTTFRSTPPYWTAFREQLKRRVGDVETEEGRQLLLSRSPNMFAGRVNRPLLIGQGLNDPRVNKAEPDQMVAALKARNIPVTYMVYNDEGHVFQRPESRISFFSVAEQVLGNCLGGRVEPIGNDFEGANFEIVEGDEALIELADQGRTLAD